MTYKELASHNLAEKLEREFAGTSEEDTLRQLSSRFQGEIVFSTSFSMEDQVITDMIFTADLPVLVFTLDTGRHFEETYKAMHRTLAKYKKKIRVCFPDAEKVERLLGQKGPYSFYESVENRKECCHIRKVEPLGKILSQASCWITGLRSGQSENRHGLKRFSFDPAHRVVKYNPLADWSLEQVTAYLRDRHIPYNTLHDKGFPSIGCAPCTRPVAPGDDIRSGRWWWEDNSRKECGLHINESETR